MPLCGASADDARSAAAADEAEVALAPVPRAVVAGCRRRCGASSGGRRDTDGRLPECGGGREEPRAGAPCAGAGGGRAESLARVLSFECPLTTSSSGGCFFFRGFGGFFFTELLPMTKSNATGVGLKPAERPPLPPPLVRAPAPCPGEGRGAETEGQGPAESRGEAEAAWACFGGRDGGAEGDGGERDDAEGDGESSGQTGCAPLPATGTGERLKAPRPDVADE